MNVKEWLGENNQLGIDIWTKKYQYNNETFDEWLDRVSGGDEDVRELIKEKKFLFAGRILSNRGLHKDGHKITYSNCYVISPPEDSIESIFDCAKRLARTFSYGGGCGIDISKLSPKGATVNNAAKETSGSVSFMDLYSLTTELIGQNGRRGALMISIACDHPDIEDFITIKSDLDKVTKANISIRVTDDFMNAVIHNKDFELKFTREETGEVIKKVVKANEIFGKFCEMNWDYAEPAFLFWDRIEKYNLLEYVDDFKYAGVNPCLTGDTIVAVADGRNGVPIKELCNTTFPVYSARLPKNGGGGRRIKSDKWIAEVKSAKAFKSGTKHVVTIKLSDGSEFRCTPDHRLALADGTYLEAKDCLNKQLAKFFTFSDKNSNKSYRHINSFTCNRQYRYIADYYNILAHDDHTIHHKDGDSTNDNPNNLASLSFSDHMKDVSESRKIDNPITRDINYTFNQGLRNISANGKRYGWSEDKIANEKAKYIETHQHLYTEKVDANCYLNGDVYVIDIIDNNEIEDVYDITVEDNHNFYIINNTDDDRYLNCSGVLVHNCAEEPLPAGGSCLLGSLNLAEFVKDGAFDYADFGKAVRIAVDGLNDVLDEGLPLHPLKEQRDSVTDWRQIGLGIMGLADMLIKLGIEYGSKESIDICDSIGYVLATTAIKESAILAYKYGSFPKFTDDVYKSKFYDIHTPSVSSRPLRNSQLLTIAPTGTLSTMLGISGGIEPIFANSYTRKTESLHGEDVEYKVYTPIVEKYMKEHNITNEENLPPFFVTSANIPHRNRIDMQAIWQRHIDASISSTVNLPNSATVEDIKDLYIYAWKKGLKGITVFRDGCKRAGILTTNNNTNETTPNNLKPNDLPRGYVLDAADEGIGLSTVIHTGCGKVYLYVKFDPDNGQPYEIFVNKGSNGTCRCNIEGIARMTSYALRSGVCIEGVVDQLQSVDACAAYAAKRAKGGIVSKGTCCPSAIGYALERLNKQYKEMFVDYEEDVSEVDVASLPTIIIDDDMICPECGEPLYHEGGCDVCRSCGYSHCG